MDWIHQFDLFLFDFDGLLVNTEEIHYGAYQKMCADRGFTLPWDFEKYCRRAHYSSTGIREGIEEDIPELHEHEPNWAVLYAEKKQAYFELLELGAVELMEGAEELLMELDKAGIARCVVTHSPLEQVEMIRQQLPTLELIPHWITREDYSKPKPDPEGYLRAIDRFKGTKVIGFEDTQKGLRALQRVPCHPVVISKVYCPEPQVSYFETLKAVTF